MLRARRTGRDAIARTSARRIRCTTPQPMRIALLVVATLTLATTARAGNFGILIPPVEVDIGVGAPIGPAVERLSPSMEILAGLHWASLAWRPTRFDIGVGYVGSFRTIEDPMRLKDDELRIHGGYFALGTTVASQKHWRTWIVARGELLRANDGHRDMSALGASLRVSTELFGSGYGGGRNGAVAGTIALGLYLEATYRDLPTELGPVGVTSGLSCRLPFLVAGG